MVCCNNDEQTLEPSNDNICAICLQPCCSGSGSTHRLECGHAFHVSCIIPWFRHRNVCCPQCRSPGEINDDKRSSPDTAYSDSDHDTSETQASLSELHRFCGSLIYGRERVHLTRWERALVDSYMAARRRHRRRSNGALNSLRSRQQQRDHQTLQNLAELMFSCKIQRMSR